MTEGADAIEEMTLLDFEPMIGGKTHSEILSMKKWKRHRWYKTISPEKREEAMEIVETVRRAKISAAWTPEMRAKMSAARTGKNSPVYGRIFSHTEETKAKLKAAWIPEKRAKARAAKIGKTLSEEHRAKLSASHTGKTHTEESKLMNSVSNKERWKDPEFRTRMSGESSPNWKGGISFEPYCPAFNGSLKENIRNRDNRTCVLCGTGEIQNGQRLSVHHIDSDKAQGCSGKKWYLCALCRSCNARPDTVEKEFLIVSNQSLVRRR